MTTLIQHERKTCRVSGEELIEVLDLGELPISCFPKPSDPPPEKHPITLSFGKTSGLLQLKHTINPDIMYSEYWYMSGINQSMKTALKSIVEQAALRSYTNLKEDDIVVDIACNDGTLLSFYPDHLIRVGIDPAKNIKPVSCDHHINTFFSADAYKQVLGEKKAKVVTSISVFYDLEDPIKFCQDISDILADDGIWILEMSYVVTMLKNMAFETICAEHLEYYSLQSIEYILNHTDLKIEDVELNDVNGGSFRLYVRKKQIAKETPNVQRLRNEERAMDLHNLETYANFSRGIEKNKAEMIDFLKQQKKEGNLVLGYGASTKGNTILAYYGITKDLLPYVADRNPIKWGRETVTRIPIISEEEARKMKPKYFLAFPYHFMNEFLSRESEFFTSGGQFISPAPKLTFYK